MRITFTANTDWYLHHFRRELADALQAEGHAVSMVCPPGPYADRLRAAGFELVNYKAPEDGFSLQANRRALNEITAAYRQLQPDLVHLFTPLCVLLGSIAARRCRVPYQVAALTGLGHIFTAESLKARVARPLLRAAFRRELSRPGTAVIFQNDGDREELLQAGVVQAAQSHLVRGSGVDIERFRPRQLSGMSGTHAPGVIRAPRILFASRLLGEKGIHELIDAFAVVRDTLPEAELWIAGERYAPNPTSLTAEALTSLRETPGVSCLGHVERMEHIFAQVDIVALPSYREGTPKVLLEAAACGLPIVATAIPGCEGLVEDGESGFLVPVRDREQLAQRLTQLAQDAPLRARMGRRGRDIVEAGFSHQQVIDRTLAVYRQLI